MKKELPKDIKKLRLYLVGIAAFIPWATWQLNIVDMENMGSIFILQVFPSLSFLILAVAASFTNEKGDPDFGKHSIIGAMVGAIIAIGIPYLLLFISAYTDTGVNIGIALLLMAMPVYLPVFMLIGWNLGERKDAI